MLVLCHLWRRQMSTESSGSCSRLEQIWWEAQICTAQHSTMQISIFAMPTEQANLQMRSFRTWSRYQLTSQCTHISLNRDVFGIFPVCYVDDFWYRLSACLGIPSMEPWTRIVVLLYGQTLAWDQNTRVGPQMFCFASCVLLDHRLSFWETSSWTKRLSGNFKGGLVKKSYCLFWLKIVSVVYQASNFMFCVIADMDAGKMLSRPYTDDDGFPPW